MVTISDLAKIPLIDIGPSNSDAAKQLLDAASKYGFVFINNDGDSNIPADKIAEMFELSKQFFAAPITEKESVSIKSNSAGKNHGWLSQGVEKLDPKTQKRPDVKEAFNIGEPINNLLQQRLPETLKRHDQTIIVFQQACHALCQRINELFAIALEIDRNWFTSRHASDKTDNPSPSSKSSSSSVFRMLYYPQTESYEDGVDIRAGAHSDYGSTTLLFQQRGQPGLEILTPEGLWASVPIDPRDPIPGSDRHANEFRYGQRNVPILVNIGDLLEDWTGGLLKSTVHRVVFPKNENGKMEDRYSMAYFCHPLDDVELEPVPSERVEEFVKHCTEKKGLRKREDGRTITARDHLRQRLEETYTVK